MAGPERKAMHLGVNTLFHVPGDVGGTETYLLEILKAIAEEYPWLHITLFTHLDNDRFMRKLFSSNEQIAFSRLPIKSRVRPLRIMAEQLVLPWYVMTSKVNVLWSPGYTAPFFSGCPQAVTVHDLQYKSYPEDLTMLERLALDSLVRSACMRCRAVIAVSEFAKSEITRFGFARQDKVFPVLEGVSATFAESVTDATVRREFETKLPMDVPYILCVAHSYPHKNIDLLIDAFDLIQKEIPHNLVIVGKPRLGEPAVEEALDRMSGTDRIYRFSEGVSLHLLRLLYQETDLFVLPSSYEGFGLPVLEALMAGSAVVCSAEASLPEVGGEYPFYLNELTAENIAQKMLEALDIPHDRQKENSVATQKWASTFTWRRAARETIDVLVSLV